MDTFGIDQAFATAVERWRVELNGATGGASVVTLYGGGDALVPERLEIRSETGTNSIPTRDWPADLPLHRIALREDPRVWDLFTTEWSMDEIRGYLDLPDDSMDGAVREAFVQSSWWREFEEMVVHAFAYEWRVALEALQNGGEVRLIVARPEPEEASLREFGSRLGRAAATFDATSHDAELLYAGASRVAAFLHGFGV